MRDAISRSGVAPGAPAMPSGSIVGRSTAPNMAYAGVVHVVDRRLARGDSAGREPWCHATIVKRVGLALRDVSSSLQSPTAPSRTLAMVLNGPRHSEPAGVLFQPSVLNTGFRSAASRHAAMRAFAWALEDRRYYSDP